MRKVSMEIGNNSGIVETSFLNERIGNFKDEILYAVASL